MEKSKVRDPVDLLAGGVTNLRLKPPDDDERRFANLRYGRPYVSAAGRLHDLAAGCSATSPQGAPRLRRKVLTASPQSASRLRREVCAQIRGDYRLSDERMF